MIEKLMLEYDYIAPRSAGARVPVLILMHGRGANRQDLAAVASRLPSEFHVILPDALHPGAPWGYGPGRAWYRFMGEDRPEGESINASLVALDELIERIPSIISASPTQLVLGGFSQGGTMGNAYVFTGAERARRVAGVLNFSGFLPSTVDVTSEAAAQTRFFWAHGTQDPSIPFSLAVKGRAALAAVGAKLEAHDYDIGHWIDPLELRDASAWLSAL
jgi:phospholipase/carboxylesterase